MSAQDGKPYVPAPFNAFLGVRFVHWSAEKSELELTITKDHLNGSFKAHGGIYATMLDNAVTFGASFAGEGLPGHRCLTLSLTTSFVASAAEGDVVTARGRIAGGGRKLIFMRGEVVDQNGRLLAHGDAIIKRLTVPANGDPAS
ncbi:MAG: hypothetical protein CML03_09065 [Pseudooceanicola sp.]|nr:hypothetical protein [Pseudooceanicola sp.]|tara:strand:- start:1116 stop:1547 length:432 start_codon:yes stop_codon:yes gene_type:complete